MSPPQRGVLCYWLAVAVLTAGYDVLAVRRWGWGATISQVMYGWAGRWPWLPALWLAAALVVLWHVAYAWWPFGGD